VIVLAAIVLAWLMLSQPLLAFIDQRNQTRRLTGLLGFIALLLSVLLIESLAYLVKRKIGFGIEMSESFRDDGVWLVALPAVLYFTVKRRANKPVQTTAMTPPPSATAPAPLSDL